MTSLSPSPHPPPPTSASLPGSPTSPHAASPAPPASRPPPSSSSNANPKPKSTKAHPRTPSPPPPPPPALNTIRLQIKLEGPDNYQVDIAALSRDTGQRPPTPVQRKADTSESEDEEAPKSAAEGADAKPKKKKKKNANTEYYDVSDPFIDDSELALDERTYFAQTKQQGFYVSSGEVALMKDPLSKQPSKTKPKSKKPPPVSIDPSASVGKEGTKDSPIALMSDDEDHPKPSQAHGHHREKLDIFAGPSLGQSLAGGIMGPSAAVTRRLSLYEPPIPFPDDEDDDRASFLAKVGEKRKRYTTVVEGGKKRKVVDVNCFHPELKKSFEVLKGAIAAENWETKGKFPPSIKPLLAQIAIQAIKLDEYDEHFFNLMPLLFPYNKFTMTKLIKRTVFADHTALLVERQDNLLKELKRLADEGFPKASEEWEKSCVAWDKRQRKTATKKNGEGGDESNSNAPTRPPSEDMDVDSVAPTPTPANASVRANGPVGKEGGKEAQPPSKRFRLTETMKAIVWELVLLSNECCRLENEKNSLEGSVLQISEQGLRKVLYQKMLGCFPSGWMSTGQISRDVSALKKRLEKEQEQEQEQEIRETAPVN